MRWTIALKMMNLVLNIMNLRWKMMSFVWISHSQAQYIATQKWILRYQRYLLPRQILCIKYHGTKILMWWISLDVWTERGSCERVSVAGSCDRLSSDVPCENCSLLYSQLMSCWPDSLNKTGLSFATANLRSVLCCNRDSSIENNEDSSLEEMGLARPEPAAINVLR